MEVRGWEQTIRKRPFYFLWRSLEPPSTGLTQLHFFLLGQGLTGLEKNSYKKSLKDRLLKNALRELVFVARLPNPKQVYPV